MTLCSSIPQAGALPDTGRFLTRYEVKSKAQCAKDLVSTRVAIYAARATINEVAARRINRNTPSEANHLTKRQAGLGKQSLALRKKGRNNNESPLGQKRSPVYVRTARVDIALGLGSRRYFSAADEPRQRAAELADGQQRLQFASLFRT
jgi:hypothetical protein